MIRAIHKPLKVQAVRFTKHNASVPDSSPFKVFGVIDRAKQSNEPRFWALPDNLTLPGRFYIKTPGAERVIVTIGDWLVKYEGSTTVEVLTSGEFHRRFRQIRDADEPVELTMETHPWPRSLNNAFDIIARADETLSSAIYAQIREQQRIEARKLEEQILANTPWVTDITSDKLGGRTLFTNKVRELLEGRQSDENRDPSATGALIREHDLELEEARRLGKRMRKSMEAALAADLDAQMRGVFTDENRDPSSDINAGKTDPRCSGPRVHGGSQCSGNGSCGHHD